MHSFLRFGLQNFCERFFSRRELAYQIATLIPENSSVLDVGCDDGSTALMIQEKNSELKFEGVDVQSHRPSKIPRKVYNGQRLPCKGASFDVVMALDVLHHTDDIPLMLRELKRVSRSLVVLKDHACENVVEDFVLRGLDYVGNAGYGIECVYNYPSNSDWNRMFSEAGLKKRDVIYFGDWWYRKIQPIFVLEV